MKVPYVIAVVALLTAALLVSTVAAGNGAPNGAHYNLNIIGVQNEKNMPLNLDNGHTIFVMLGKNEMVSTKILLAMGVDYRVLDKDGTDREASFQLPASGCYDIYARPRGTPGGSTTMTTCYEDAGTVYCYANSLTLTRTTGKQNFQPVNNELKPIFASQDFFWYYNNTGLKLAQLRFYENSSGCY